MSLAYLAGLFDGEGCISASCNQGQRRRYVVLAVAVGMTHPAGPTAFRDAFGGQLRIKSSCQRNERPQLVWRCKGGRIVSEVLTALRPYLQVKALEADIALALCARQHAYQRCPGRPLGANETFLRTALAGLLRAAKGRRINA